MTESCRLFETQRKSDETAFRIHARACSDCEMQLFAENAVQRIMAAEARLSADLPPVVLPVRRRSAVRLFLAGAILAAALLEVVLLGSGVIWTPAVMLACAGCSALAFLCGDLLADE